MDTDISFIIPCKNEEQHIPACLKAILAQDMKWARSLEIIVVDNGSTDNTLQILKKFGARIQVFQLAHVTISELRNYGASHCTGEWLAFIDADVEITEKWASSLAATLQISKKQGKDLKTIITGSTYQISQFPTWVERVWFQQLVSRDKENTTYINAGNLIVHRSIFEKIGGFNPAFKTGEDVQFCKIALQYGGTIIKNSEIAAVHHGYPKTIGQFFRRERWHGLGMGQYLLRPWQGKDLMMAQSYLFSALLLVFLALTTLIPFPFILSIGIALNVFPALMIAGWRSRETPCFILPLSFLFFIYGWARAFSLIDILRLKLKAKK